VKALAAGIALAAVCAWADDAALARFSSIAPGPLPPPWRELRLANIKPAEIALVADAGTTVLRVHSAAASGSAAHALSLDPAGVQLAWRWKVDRVVEKADLARKPGDDFAARVYVFYDLPRASLPLATRARLRVIEWLYGEKIPTAAICYIWDNRHPVGTRAWNPYSDRVRMVVLRSGAGEAGQWKAESRDLERDYRDAFGGDAALPRVSGIAAGNDTDQTGETATVWFGDFRLEPRS
jgi:hypothetical protein